MDSRPSPEAESGTAVRHLAPWWSPLAVAIGFLTVIPVPGVVVAPSVAGRAAATFPVLGALVGLGLGGIGLLLDRVLPAGPVAALLIAAGVLVSGGLHLDGLMDTADGLAAGRSREQRLAIMRDSRVGAFGAMAAILAILAQFACLSELTGAERLLALVVAAATSRWAMLAAMALFPPARPDGLGATFRSGVSPTIAGVGTLVLLGLVLYARPFGAIALMAGTGVVLVVGNGLTRRLGGLTGDTYGAIAVVTETVVLFAAVALATA